MALSKKRKGLIGHTEERVLGRCNIAWLFGPRKGKNLGQLLRGRPFPGILGFYPGDNWNGGDFFQTGGPENALAGEKGGEIFPF